MREDVYEKMQKIGKVINFEPVRKPLNGLGGTSMTLGKTTVKTEIDDLLENMTFWVVPRESMDFMALIGDPLLDFAEVHLKKSGPTVEPIYEEYIRLVKSENDDIKVATENVPDDFKEEITKILRDYKPAKVEEVPVEMKIILKDEKPIARPPATLAWKEQEEVEKGRQQQ